MFFSIEAGVRPLTMWLLETYKMGNFLQAAYWIAWSISTAIVLIWIKGFLDLKKENNSIKKELEKIRMENESIRKKLSRKTDDERQLEQMRAGKPYLLVTRNG